MRIRKVYLFRHGETDWNREMRFQGHIDIPLNDQGRQQALQLIHPLRAAKIDCILSSDLSRAHETASIINQYLGAALVREPLLREAHLGEAQGLTPDEMKARFGDRIVLQWKSNLISDADVSYPGGETGRDIQKRALGAIEAFLEQTTHPTIAVSTHGGVIRRILQFILPERGELIPIPNCVLYPLEWDTETREWRMTGLNPSGYSTEILKLSRRGVWLSNDDEILHERTVQAFHQHLVRDPQGITGWKIKIGWDQVPVDVEDTPSFIDRIRFSSTGEVEIGLLHGAWEHLDFTTLELRDDGAEQRMTCRLKNGEVAKFLTVSYHSLLSHLDQDERGYFLKLPSGHVKRLPF